MDWEDSPLWPEGATELSPQYRLLLKMKIFSNIRLQELPANDLGLSPINTKVHYQFEFLFDMYWNNPRILDEMISQLTIPLPQHQQYSFLPTENVGNPNLIREFLYPYGILAKDALASNTVYLTRLDADRRMILGIQDQQLLNFIQSLESFGPASFAGLYDGNLQRWAQYQSSLKQRLDKCKTEACEYIRQFLKMNGASEDITRLSDSSDEVDLAEVAARIRIEDPGSRFVALFAVSGSGKTRSIERLLSQHFGFYFQSCIEPGASTGIHSARRLPGSRDTRSLRNMIKFGISIIQDVPDVDRSDWVYRWVSHLVDYRLSVFAMFLKIATETGISAELLPRLWFQLQTRSKNDLFDEGFQLSCLIENTRGGFWKKFDFIRQTTGTKQFYFCLDEAQVDLDVVVPERTSLQNHEVSLLSVWATIFMWIGRWFDGYERITPLIFSGTSLNTKDAVEAIIRWGRHHVSRTGPEQCSIFSEFPLIKSDKQFKKAMDKHGLANIRLRNLISELAQPLYGRPRWSVRYLERVMLLENASSIQSDSGLEDRIRKAATQTINEVKEDLLSRLYRLQQLGWPSMDHLCRVVVYSDLMDRPTPFMDEAGPTMVEQAFAVLRRAKDGSSNYRLEERLALEAAKEFILIELPDTVERSLQRFLDECAKDASSFGKAAETWLAWNLNRAFVEDGGHNGAGLSISRTSIASSVDRLCGSNETDRLPRLLDMLGSAESLDTIATPGIFDLSGHTIISGVITGHKYDGSVALTEWMRRVRDLNDRPNATFFFPENTVGPDLVFALQSKSSAKPDGVLCLLQLKCGDPELEKGILSTNLQHAYHSENGLVLKGHEEKYEQLMKELKEWQNAGWRILRILVTAAVREASRKARQPPKKGSPCREYYIRCDAKQTELLFGKEFQGLLQAVRGGGQSLTSIYDTCNEGENARKRRRTGSSGIGQAKRQLAGIASASG